MSVSASRVSSVVRPALAAVVLLLGMVGANLVPGVHLPIARDRILPCGALPGRSVPSQGKQHLAYLGEPHVPYNTQPPTSGPHLPWIIATGVYREPIPDELQVHLLEHGNVLVQYPPDAPEALRRQVEDVARKHPNHVVVAPDTRLRGGVALTAWQRIQLLAGYDRSAVERFVSALAGRYDHGWVAGAGDCL